MEKNVLVVDELGNEYGATYPKRAKGLVKHGRARFIDEHTICLACPPDRKNLEDSTMSDNNTNIIEYTNTAEEQQIESAAPELTVEYVLAQIKAIQDEDAYIYHAMNELAQIQSAGPGDIAGQQKSKSIGDVVTAREETNRKLIESYMKIYNDLTAETMSETTLRDRCLEIVATAVHNPAGIDISDLYTLFNTIRNM